MQNVKKSKMRTELLSIKAVICGLTAWTLVACGGGGTATPSPALVPTMGIGGIPVTLGGNVRSITNTLYKYSSPLASDTSTTYAWTWGDTGPAYAVLTATTNPTPKVWGYAGTFANNTLLQTTGTGAAVNAQTVKQNTVVIGGPIAVGSDHSCALKADNTVMCWGFNGGGALGIGAHAPGANNSPLPVHGLTDVVAITAGDTTSCALKSNGAVYCWGDNGSGQVGNGTTGNNKVIDAPVQVAGINTARSISSGNNFSCALLADGVVKCWGGNSRGQLGNGTTIDSNTPVTVSGLTNAVAISAGARHACAIKSDSTAVCWGFNNYGGLGNGTTTDSSTIVSVNSLTNLAAIAAGDDYTCALRVDGSVACWGYSSFGHMGNGNTNETDTQTPKLVGGLTDIVALTAGNRQTCALKVAGTVVCWGGNDDGQLGDGTILERRTPTGVQGLSNVVALSASNGTGSTTCALKNDGSVHCWGANRFGELGDGVSPTGTVAGHGSSNLAYQPLPKTVASGAVFWK